jgi:hypothetical protein
MQWAGMRQIRNVYKSFVEKPEGKKPLKRYRRRLENNTKMNSKEIWCEGMV